MYDHAGIFLNKLFKFYILGILYNAIMHKQGFGQAKCIDLITRIYIKFTLIFSKFSIVLFKLWMFELIF
jgi:hypothetical protein